MNFIPIRDFLPLLSPADRRQWILLLAAAIASGISRSLFLGLVNAAIAAGGRWGDVIFFGTCALAAVVIIVAADFFAAVRGKEAATRMALQLRRQYVDRLGSSNLQLIEREGIDELHYHLMNTINLVASTYSLLLLFANGIVTLAFNVAYIGWLSPIGLLVALSIILVGVGVHWNFERINEARRRRIETLTVASYATNHSYLMAYKELRLSTAKTADYRDHVDAINASFLKETVGETRLSSYGNMATNLFEYLAIASVGLILPALIGLKPVTAMQLLSAILFTIGPLVAVVGAFSGFGQVRIAFDRLAKLRGQIDAMQEPAAAAGHQTLPAFETIALDNVSFAFERAEGAAGEEFQLGPIDLTLRRGEIVCIAGGNGSGKTVLMRLLTGLYHPGGGRMLFNGKPLAEDQRQAYREKFTAIFSDFFLFQELLGQRDTAPAKVMAMLERFDLKGKTGFSNGEFSTVALSSGQRKRLALVVSLLEDRPIMVMDEFGADQDPGHRHMFYRQWLEDLRRMGKTVIVVSHDDRYFDAADRIIRLDFGRIVEDRVLREAPVIAS